MRLLSLPIGALLVTAAFGCAARAPVAVGLDPQALAAVRTVFLGDFGREESADIVKEKLRMKLMQSDRFSIVESEAVADAVLTGSVGVSKSQSNGTSEFSGIGLLRLVDRRSQRTIWTHQYRGTLNLTQSASSRVANQMAEQLLKAAGGSARALPNDGW